MRGQVAEGFEPVRAAVAELAAAGSERGAGVAVVRDGKAVVDLQVGWVDAAHERRWEPDTLTMVYSVSKPVSALTTLHAVTRAGLDLDQPIVAWWPEYGGHGKDTTTLRHLLCHQGGLPAFPTAAAGLRLTDRDGLEAVLAAAEPEWPPGSAHAEHALTYGTLLGAVLRRATGVGLGTWMADFGQHVGIPDLLLGVGPRDLARTAELQAIDAGWAARTTGPAGSDWYRALSIPAGALDPAVMNRDDVRRAELGAIGVHTSAFALAALFADLLDDAGRLATMLGPTMLEQVRTPQVLGPDAFFALGASWGLGMPVETDEEGALRWAGMGGVGGSLAYADARHGIGVAYVTRWLSDAERAERVAGVIDALPTG